MRDWTSSDQQDPGTEQEEGEGREKMPKTLRKNKMQELYVRSQGPSGRLRTGCGGRGGLPLNHRRPYILKAHRVPEERPDTRAERTKRTAATEARRRGPRRKRLRSNGRFLHYLAPDRDQPRAPRPGQRLRRPQATRRPSQSSASDSNQARGRRKGCCATPAPKLHCRGRASRGVHPRPSP